MEAKLYEIQVLPEDTLLLQCIQDPFAHVDDKRKDTFTVLFSLDKSDENISKELNEEIINKEIAGFKFIKNIEINQNRFKLVGGCYIEKV